MNKNKLYNFIKDKLLNSSETFGRINKKKFFSKITTQQSHYILYELMNKKQSILHNSQQYNLKSHHVSFYQEKDERNSCLSQYHYTAYFEAREGNIYQLHVYFNRQDQLTTEPLLSIQNEDCTHTPQAISIEFSSILTQFAIDNCFDFISDLRTAHHKTLEEYENIYQEKEQKLRLLSVNLQENHGAYQTLLGEAIQVLDSISHYQDSKQFEAILRIFRRMSATLIAPPTWLSQPQVSLETLDNAKYKDKTEKQKTITRMPQKNKLSQSQSLASSIQEAMMARDVFLKSTQEKDQIQLFLAFNNYVQDALILTEEEGSSPTPDDLHKIQILLSQASSEAKKLLITLLLKKQYESARSLSYFLKNLPDNLIKMALTTGNAELLNFLLTEGDFAINTMVIADNLSPVLFCFQRNSDEHPKVECLSVLIKHNASVMVKADDGLPIAHHILSSIHHPLKKALFENDATSKPYFYKVLAQTIATYLANHKIEEALNNKLLMSIDYYHYESQSPTSDSLINSRVRKQNLQKYEDISTHFDKSSIEFIEQDKDILLKRHKVLQAFAEEKNKFSSKIQRQFLLQEKKVINNLEKLVRSEKVSDMFQLKQQCLVYLDDSLRMITLISDCFAIQKEQKSRASSKRYAAKLNKRFSESTAELKVLSEKYKFLGEPSNQTSVEELINELEKELNVFIEILAKYKKLGTINNAESTQVPSTSPSSDATLSGAIGFFGNTNKNDDGISNEERLNSENIPCTEKYAINKC